MSELKPSGASKTMSRREWLRLAATGVAASAAPVLLAACAAPAAPAAPAAAVPPPTAETVVIIQTAVPLPTQVPVATPRENITLTALSDFTGDPKVWDQVWREMQEDLGITMNLIQMPFADVETKLLTMVAAGTQPDLMMGHPMVVGTFGSKHLVVDLQPYITAENYDMNYLWPGARSALAYQGEVYTLPYSYNFLLYYYNTKVIEAAGLEDPYAVWKAGKWDFDTFVKYGDEISKGTGDKQIFSITEPPHTARVQLSFLRAFGGEIWSADGKEVVCDTPEALQGWDFCADHIRKGWSPAAAGRDQGYQPTMTPLFNDDRIALYLNNRGYTSTFDLAKLKPGMVPYPVWPVGKSITRCVGEGLMAMVGTKYPDRIYEANKWWSTRGHKVLLLGGASAPNGPALMDSSAWLSALKPWEKNDAYKFAAETGMPDVLPPGFGEADKICQSFYDEVALGKRSSKEAMADARKGMQGVLDEYVS